MVAGWGAEQRGVLPCALGREARLMSGGMGQRDQTQEERR